MGEVYPFKQFIIDLAQHLYGALFFTAQALSGLSKMGIWSDNFEKLQIILIIPLVVAIVVWLRILRLNLPTTYEAHWKAIGKEADERKRYEYEAHIKEEVERLRTERRKHPIYAQTAARRNDDISEE